MTGPISRREFVERTACAAASTSLPGRLTRQSDALTLANDSVEATWSVAGGTLRAVRFRDKLLGSSLTLPADVFVLTLREGASIGASSLRLRGAPRFERLAPNPRASRRSEQLAGQQVTVALADDGGRLQAEWRGVLRDGSRYVRQEITLRAIGAELPVREVALVDPACARCRGVRQRSRLTRGVGHDLLRRRAPPVDQHRERGPGALLPRARAAAKSADWEARVRASKFGPHVHFGRNASGFIALQDHGDEVAFRNIKVRVLL